jgi:1-acyl-sn-glycerol-3-phosphate acyltransferase
MKILRAVARLSLLVPFTAAVCGLNSLALLPTRLLSRDRAMALRSAGLAFWARGARRILGLRIVVQGRPPDSPCFLVSNHLGYLDVVVIASLVRCCFVAKREVAGWPVLGLLVRSMNTIFVDREHASSLPGVVDVMERALAARGTVAFFPEGTSSGGERLLPFRRSLFEAPARTGHPVSCASLSYGVPDGEPPASCSVCWWGDMTFAGHLWRLLQLPRIDAFVRFHDGWVRGGDRRELAERAHQAVGRCFRALAGEGA